MVGSKLVATVIKQGSSGNMQLRLSLQTAKGSSSCVAKACVLETVGRHCKEVLCLSGLAPVLHSLKSMSSSLQGPCVSADQGIMPVIAAAKRNAARSTVWPCSLRHLVALALRSYGLACSAPAAAVPSDEAHAHSPCRSHPHLQGSALS